MWGAKAGCWAQVAVTCPPHCEPQTQQECMQLKKKKMHAAQLSPSRQPSPRPQHSYTYVHSLQSSSSQRGNKGEGTGGTQGQQRAGSTLGCSY